jgi:DNA sulfur modification protein DndD
MRFTRIKIENFRQHKSVELAFDEDRGMFVVVKGKMGAGKTNLLNAFTWCLYGEVDDKKLANPEILNQSVLLSTDLAEYVDVTVTLDIDLDDFGKASVKRKQTYKKTGERAAVQYDSPDLFITVMSSLDKGYRVEPQPEQWIEKFLPQRFKPYFLFDGERLERFFKETDAPLIKAAIQEIASIDLLERLALNFSAARDETVKAVAKLSGTDGARLSEEYDRIQDLIKVKTADLKSFEEQIIDSEKMEEELDKKLGNIQELERNISDKRRLEREIANAEQDLARHESQFLFHTRENGPVAFLSKALLALKEHTDTARRNKVLPPPFDLEALEGLLEEGSCICGTNLSEGSSHKAHIRGLIDRYEEVSELGSLLSEHVVQQTSYLAQIPSGFALLETLNNNIMRDEDRLTELRQALKELEKALTGHDDFLIQNLAERRRDVRNSRDRATNDQRLARSELDKLKLESQNLRRDIEKASATSKKAMEAKHISEFAGIVSAAAQDLYQGMNDQVRASVAESLDSQFKQMTWKKDGIKEVSIDSNFKVSVVNNRDFEILGKLSAGERLCLAFAFSLTLSTVAGLDFPMVVDTPMGRLSPEVQVHLATVLGQVTKPGPDSRGHQLIMLMTETEYNTSVAAALESRQPKVYEINFNQELAETEILETR